MNRNQRRHQIPPMAQTKPIAKSLLDIMKDGREFESLISHRIEGLNIAAEIRRALAEIKAARSTPNICYMANVVNPNIKASKSIEYADDLPFSEMVASVPTSVREIDIILATPGGLAQQVSKFVDRLRPRFEKVNFIIPNIAMSAGTIFAMSGDEIVMDSRSYIGPIDPQVPNRDGVYMPAQAILTLVSEIQRKGEESLKKGQNPAWTDLQILKQIDGKEIGNAVNASNYSIELVENYLSEFKFKTWSNHSDGRPVTPADKRERAKQIASQFCNHELWKTHSRGITREIAWDICRLKVTHAESIPGLERALRRFWATIYWVFENTVLTKIFLSEDYGIFRQDRKAAQSGG